MGDPSSVLTAAKLPAAATTAPVRSGVSRLARRTAQTPSPPPSAISGASGPSTAPRPIVASAASAMPGSSIGEGAPLGLNPSAGDSPPLPGRYRMVSPTSTPATASGSSGHHVGARSKPSPLGRSVNTHPWRLSANWRKPYEAVEIGTPMIAAKTSSTR